MSSGVKVVQALVSNRLYGRLINRETPERGDPIGRSRSTNLTIHTCAGTATVLRTCNSYNSFVLVLTYLTSEWRTQIYTLNRDFNTLFKN